MTEGAQWLKAAEDFGSFPFWALPIKWLQVTWENIGLALTLTPLDVWFGDQLITDPDVGVTSEII